MTPENLADAVQLALYRVSDRLGKRVPFDEELVSALREVADELGNLTTFRAANSESGSPVVTLKDTRK